MNSLGDSNPACSARALTVNASVFLPSTSGGIRKQVRALFLEKGKPRFRYPVWGGSPLRNSAGRKAAQFSDRRSAAHAVDDPVCVDDVFYVHGEHLSELRDKTQLAKGEKSYSGKVNPTYTRLVEMAIDMGSKIPVPFTPGASQSRLCCSSQGCSQHTRFAGCLVRVEAPEILIAV